MRGSACRVLTPRFRNRKSATDPRDCAVPNLIAVLAAPGIGAIAVELAELSVEHPQTASARWLLAAGDPFASHRVRVRSFLRVEFPACRVSSSVRPRRPSNPVRLV
jgi:hypothetical protein